ncbi:MAG: OsmC family peroxiredoxin, partial [Nitratireductor sp.]|nr:OsmC family peroxiredoxin [Nitratireductor sp.]
VETMIEGDIDLQGIFGMSGDVRNGFNGIRATFRISGDAPAEMLEKVVQQAVARSAVFDVLTNGVPVSVAAVAA